MSPTLPAELIRDIAETAALDAPGIAPTLCLVSHALKEWIEPLLYTVVRIDAHEIVPPTLRNPLGHQYPIILPALHKFSKHVRHILIHGRTTLEASQILSCCPNLIGVGLWMLHGNPMEVFRHLQPPSRPQPLSQSHPASNRSIGEKETSVQTVNLHDSPHDGAYRPPAIQSHNFGYLSFDPAVTFHQFLQSRPNSGGTDTDATSSSLRGTTQLQLTGPPITDIHIPQPPSPFANVSHLELRNTTIQPRLLASLAQLPCLTHMAIYGDLAGRILLDILRALPNLQVLISFYYHLENMRLAVEGTGTLDRDTDSDGGSSVPPSPSLSESPLNQGADQPVSSVPSKTILCISRAQLVNILKRWEVMARRGRKEVDYWGRAAALMRVQTSGIAPASGGRRVIDFEGFIGRIPDISQEL